VVEHLAATLEDVLATLGQIRKKFNFSFSIDADDLGLFGEDEDDDDSEWGDQKRD
jgi:hypothetical protein